MIALSVLISTAKNLEQREMTTEDNEQEQRWRHKRDTNRATRGDKQDN